MEDTVFYFGNIFLTCQEEALLLLSDSIYPLIPQRMCLSEKQPSLCLWLLWATPRSPKGTFSYISAVRGTFLEEFEKLSYQGQLYWSGGFYDVV